MRGDIGFKGKKLAKAALAKNNSTRVIVDGIAGDTVSQLNSLSQALGITYDSNNNVLDNETTADINSNTSRLDAIEAIKWDDLKAPASSLATDGSVKPPTRDTVDGSLIFETEQSIAIWFQMPHAWLEGSEIRPHLHYVKETSESGLVSWTMSYKWANPLEVFPSLSTPTLSSIGVPDGDTANQHALSTFNSITDATKQISSMLCIVIERDLATDTYAGDVKLLEMDIHYQIDSKGSVQEYIK